MIKRATEKAVLVNIGVNEEIWVPKSQINDWSPNVDFADWHEIESIFVPEWLAKDKGMI